MAARRPGYPVEENGPQPTAATVIETLKMDSQQGLTTANRGVAIPLFHGSEYGYGIITGIGARMLHRK